MLVAARRTADAYPSRLGADPIPNWDFDAPSVREDSSAGAAAALFELAGDVGAADARRYRQAASAMLDALASPASFDAGARTQALLLDHGSATIRRASRSTSDSSMATITFSGRSRAARRCRPPMEAARVASMGARARATQGAHQATQGARPVPATEARPMPACRPPMQGWRAPATQRFPRAAPAATSEAMPASPPSRPSPCWRARGCGDAAAETRPD